MKIWFDMDGTIADFYGVEGWLDDLHRGSARPYKVARPLWNMRKLSRCIRKAQAQGNEVGIISWSSRGASADFDMKIARAKRAWLAKHLPAVHFDEIKIVRYGINKRMICGGGILFDDNDSIRADWGKGAYRPEQIFDII